MDGLVGRMRERRRWQSPAALLPRLRWAFLVVTLVLVVLAAGDLAMRLEGSQLALAVLALGALSAWFVAGYQRDALAASGSLVVETAVLAALVTVSASVVTSLNVFYPALFFASLYASRRQAWLRPVLYWAALAAPVLTGAAPVDVVWPFLLSQAIGFMVVSQVMCFVQRTAMQHQDATEAARRHIAALEELEDVKNLFLAAVSHELRTPLTSVKGAVFLLRDRIDELDTAEQAHLLERAGVNAERLERLLDDLLDIQKLTRGAVEAQRQAVDVNALARSAVADLGITDHPVYLDDEPAVSPVDPSLVDRIVANLVANAARHTPPGTPVWVRTSRQQDGVLILVEDAGPGVPGSLKRTIFDPHHHHHVQGGPEGSGLGLAIVARFAELHGGRAWVEDRPGGGARFCVVLPDDPPMVLSEAV